MDLEIYIFTNGRPTTFPAMEYGARLGATLAEASVRLIGIEEQPSPAQIDEEQHPLEKVFAQAVEIFEQQGVFYALEVMRGPAEEVIPKRVAGQQALVVIGPLGRPPLKRLLAGRSFRHFMEHVSEPMIYVPKVKWPPKRILVCVGGLGYQVTAENLAIRLAKAVQAEMVLLTVVPPIDLDYPEARQVREHWHHLLETDTLIGKNLRRGLEIARQAGLQASVKVRNGIVIGEIVDEIKEGGYELICMGSPYSTQTLRQLYSPNITAEIAERDLAPVLTARYKPEG